MPTYYFSKYCWGNTSDPSLKREEDGDFFTGIVSHSFQQVSLNLSHSVDLMGLGWDLRPGEELVDPRRARGPDRGGELEGPETYSWGGA